jgi:hypothetical protein
LANLPGLLHSDVVPRLFDSRTDRPKKNYAKQNEQETERE